MPFITDDDYKEFMRLKGWPTKPSTRRAAAPQADDEDDEMDESLKTDVEAIFRLGEDRDGEELEGSPHLRNTMTALSKVTVDD